MSGYGIRRCCCDTAWWSMGFHASDGSLSWKVTADGGTTGAVSDAAAGNILGHGVDSSDNVYCRSNRDENNNSNAFAPYIHKFNSSGVRQWTINLFDDDPTPMGASSKKFTITEPFCDSSGNTHFIWQAISSGTPVMYAVKYNSSGALQWTSNELIAEITAQTGHLTWVNSVDLNTITGPYTGGYRQLMASGNVICWLIHQTVTNNDFYEHGVEIDSSGAFVRTYTAFDVTSSPTRSGIWHDSWGRAAYALPSGEFYLGFNDAADSGDVICQTANELKSWRKTVSTAPNAFAWSTNYANVDSSGDLWLPVNGGCMEIYAKADGTVTSFDNGDNPTGFKFFSGGDILISTSGVPTGESGNIRRVNTSEVTQTEFAWPRDAHFLTPTSTNGCVVSYPNAEI